MVLSELLKAIQPIQIIGSTETEITGVTVSYTHLTLPTT